MLIKGLIHQDPACNTRLASHPSTSLGEAPKGSPEGPLMHSYAPPIRGAPNIQVCGFGHMAICVIRYSQPSA